jgi:RNA polymerase sigma factor (sigma-70 family)
VAISRRPTGTSDEEREFDAFFNGVFPRAVGLVCRITGDRTLGEDAAVEALAKADRHWHRLDPQRRSAWVMKVAVNEALKRRTRSSLVPDDRAHVDDPAELVVIRSSLAAALAALPRRQREVVVLRHLVGLSEAEVASTLRLSLGTVKTHLRRGLARLRDGMDHPLREEPHAELA